MKVIVTTDEYTIYQKRSERYAVRDAQRNWVNGDAKVTILLKNKLIEAATPKAPEPEVVETVAEPVVEETAAADDAPSEEEGVVEAEASAEEAPAEEAPSEKEGVAEAEDAPAEADKEK